MERLNLKAVKTKDKKADSAILLGLKIEDTSAFSSIEKMVENTLEIEFGGDFTKQVGFAKMVGKIAEVIKRDAQLSEQAQLLIEKSRTLFADGQIEMQQAAGENKVRDDQENQPPYDNPTRKNRRSN